MNKRAIVNVATGEFYCKMQERLIRSFRNSVDHIFRYDKDGGGCGMSINNTTGISLITWDDCLPKGSRSHQESPYGFKVHAIKAAYEMGYTSILWLDSPVYAVKEDISPIFDKIEKEGYYAMSHIDPLERFVGDHALSFFDDLKRDDINRLNLPSGSCYGFDLNNKIGSFIFFALQSAEESGFFVSEVGDDFVHRHDEAILALSIREAKKEVFTFDPLFQSDSPECIIKSGGL